MSTHKLKINLYGEAWKLKRLVLPEELVQIIEIKALKMRQPVTEVIIDPFFYHYLKNDKIHSVEDLKGNSIQGLINSSKNQIEIWFRNKKVQKLKINDLNSVLLLFPLYNTTIQTLNYGMEKGIYLEQKEIGFVGSFEINTDNFNIEDLEFQLLQTNELTLLDKLVYKNEALTCKKKDTLITFQNCFEVL